MNMGLLKLFGVFPFLAYINLTTQETVNIQITLDSDCRTNYTDGSGVWYPRARAVNSTGFYLAEINTSLEISTCCCTTKNVSCSMNDNGCFDLLSSFVEYLNNGSVLSGTYIARIVVNKGHKSEACSGYTHFDLPIGNHTDNHTDFTASNMQNSNLNHGITTNELISCQNQMTSGQSQKTSSPDRQTGDKAKTIGGAVGGTLGGLAVLLPLSYYMYKRFKRTSQVDDANSTTGLFGATPVGSFEDAPNSMAPAGTG